MHKQLDLLTENYVDVKYCFLSSDDKDKPKNKRKLYYLTIYFKFHEDIKSILAYHPKPGLTLENEKIKRLMSITNRTDLYQFVKNNKSDFQKNIPFRQLEEFYKNKMSYQ